VIYAATGEERIGNGYLPRDASGHQQAGYLRGCGGTEVCSIAADKRIHETTDLQTFAFLIKIIR